MLELAEPQGPKIKVVGVGGGGGNAVNTMIDADVQGVEFIAANTDCQVLETNLAPTKIQIGKGLTKGLGAGANPEIGCAAAMEDLQRLGEVLQGADMVFVTAGMGGGTGTGAAPVIARTARELGALTVGVVTKPFLFEGLQRKKKAISGIAELSKAVDALIVIPNDRLVSLAGKALTLKESFNMVDNVCLTAVRGISDLVMVPGLINVDFADVRSIMTGMGRALMGSGRGTGERRALDAAQMAITSPLLEDVSIDGATGILVNISGGPDLTLAEVTEACSLVHEAADPDANIIFGSVIDPNLRDEVRITVIATGFQSRQAVEASTNTRPTTVKRPLENQMTLPIGSGPKPAADLAPPQIIVTSPAAPVPTSPVVSSSAAVPSSSFATASAVSPAPAYAVETRSQPLPTFSLDADRTPGPHLHAFVGTPVSAPLEAVDTAVDEPEPEPQYPPLSSLLTPGPAQLANMQTPVPMQASDSRPVIRPAVQSMVATSASVRRPMATQPLAPDALGIEENEYDKPTYLRRAMAGDSVHSFRAPGDTGGKV